MPTDPDPPTETDETAAVLHEKIALLDEKRRLLEQERIALRTRIAYLRGYLDESDMDLDSSVTRYLDADGSTTTDEQCLNE